MSPEEISEGNKLIVNVLGYIYHKQVDIDYSDCGGIYDRTDVYSKVPILTNDFLEEDDQIYFQDDWYSLGYHLKSIEGELKYHYSWDCLMPVVEELEKMYPVHIRIQTGICCIIRKFMSHKRYAKENNINTEDVPPIAENNEYLFIENVWKSVVETIKYYNENKN